MKKLYVLACLLLAAFVAYPQAKKPTLMVVPSDNWCIQNGFVQEFDNQGKMMKLPDYRRALQESFDLVQVIAKINELMAERGFPLKNLESTLKSIENQSAEDAMYSGSNELRESPIDVLKKTARADIWIQLSWNINTSGPKKSITFILQGLDAYTDKQIAGASGTGSPSFSVELPVLLEEAVLSHLDNFNVQLQAHFEDMFANGREVILRIRATNSLEYGLETEYDGKELSTIIEDWVNDNTVQHRFSTSDITENFILFEQVRIPLYDESGNPADTRRWARGLQKYLKDTYKIDAKILTRGLGQVQLIVG
ncbi:MAG: DUF6175 family protein [Bacteroidales bacterium]|jgi:hypothetical protein|nr:DUF6175 family protein [Bacteroidales bacterium]